MHTRRRMWLVAGVLLVQVAGVGARSPKDKTLPPAAPRPGSGQEVEGLFEKKLRTDLADVREIVFAGRSSAREWHFFATTGYRCFDPNVGYYSPSGGRLCALDLRSGKMRMIFEDLRGAVRDPAVSYDGRRVLFSYRPGDERVFHLYEIGIDGRGLRQITDGPFDDVEPVYVPDGGIVFASARCRRYVPCMNSQVQMLYRCEVDGSGLRPLSAGQENELTPWVLPDGRIVYMRWEYVERDVRTYHHLWTINPDGTGEMVYFGNGSNSYVSVPGGVVMLNPKPIPGTRKVVCSVGSRHGSKEYHGHVAIIDPSYGPNDWRRGVRYLTAGDSKNDEVWRDPYPVSDDCFLVARDDGLYVMDSRGDHERFYTYPGGMVHEPVVLAPSQRETVIPSRYDPSATTGTMILSEAHVGRNMDGIEPGDIRKLLVLEVLPKPISYGHPSKIRGAGHNLKRVLGTVPVEPDGSAHFEAPAYRALMFVALDANDRAIKRMRSFLTLMPGETASCVGCHEQRTYTGDQPGKGALAALQRGPSRLERIAGLPETRLIDFPRDVQPILDRHCVSCHSQAKRAGGLALDDSFGPGQGHAYSMLRRRVAMGKSEGNDPPYSTGTGAAKLWEMIQAGHGKATLTQAEKNLLRCWIDSGAYYAGTWAAMSPKEREGVGATDEESRWTVRMDADVLQRRCDGCHGPPRKRFGRKILDNEAFDLAEPLKSQLLRAPLARSAGGLGLCRDKKTTQRGEGAVFASKDDADYRTLRDEVVAVCRELKPENAWWTGEFVGHPTYVREMKRYGALPRDFEYGTVFDPYAVDDRYHKLFYPDSEAYLYAPGPDVARTDEAAREGGR